MTSASLTPKTHKSGATYYYAVFRDAAREPPVKWIALNTTDPKIARQRFATWEREEAMGIADPWTSRARAAAGSLTTREAAGRFAKALARTARPNTLAQRQSALKHLLALVVRGQPLGDLPVTSVAARHVHEATTKPVGRGGGAAAPTTRRAVYDAADAFLAWCAEQGLIRSHPLRGAAAGGEGPPQGHAEPYHVLTPDEMRRITAHIRHEASTKSRRRGREVVAAAAELAVASGLRIGELVQLTWQDVSGADLAGAPAGAAVLHVVQSHKRGRSTKTGRSRHVAVFPLGVRALGDLRRIAAVALGRDVRSSDPVVVGPLGAAFDISRLNNRFREAAAGAGVPGVHWHDMRHTYISWSVNELAIPITVCAELAGHRDIRMTAAYQRPSPATMLDSVARALTLAGVAAPVAGAGAEPFYAGVARYVAGLPPAAPAEPTAAADLRPDLDLRPIYGDGENVRIRTNPHGL